MPRLEKFDRIEKRAAKRKGGPAALEELLPTPKSARSLSRIGDDRYLSAMGQMIFSAGFVWKVVENKWPEFEVVFSGFDPLKVARKTDKQIDKISSDKRVIRNGAKLFALRDNARFIVDVAGEHGSFAKWIGAWPESDLVGLLAELKARGSRLGGNSGVWFLRHMGKDTFMFTPDVVKALQRSKVVTKTPTSKKDLAAAQAAFNEWHEQSGRPYCQISKILACSV